ncbi:Cof subfamily protein (haloacid dehalogenase superfamily) [Ereboglobus sp. PH5-5]|uniref:HAD family hydrolase n=1 Tax=unclassified Ereboglobus TaxID=2626932 RepID=UPI002405ACEC|nr:MULTISPECIES: HAD family hydrolase [unclassified Ereboglobus]MDF9828203.1 Cof subfamily protein (haloacid dehalogenase superfamily) [Ereboglobus sp. PH5-10]MDF9832430.1 Cof subfamily protein (haloacid dehalogenase superfamily) [Ereboglobus sp. PH5-5]
MIKLVVTDIDGTLVDDNKNLSPDFWETVEKLTRKGIVFAIASGRQYHALVRQFERIKDRTLFIAENGAYAAYENRELFTVSFNPAVVHNFIKIGRTIPDTYPVLCGKNSTYVENDDEYFLSVVNHYCARLQRVDDLTQVGDTLLKFSMFDLVDSETNSYPHFKQFERDYKVAAAGKRWLDMTAPDANKGSALRRVQEQLGISPDETLVFGDYLNDLEMMREAKHSYAMKNAHPEIIKAANFVTDLDNNNYGVVDMIRKLCLGG